MSFFFFVNCHYAEVSTGCAMFLSLFVCFTLFICVLLAHESFSVFFLSPSVVEQHPETTSMALAWQSQSDAMVVDYWQDKHTIIAFMCNPLSLLFRRARKTSRYLPRLLLVAPFSLLQIIFLCLHRKECERQRKMKCTNLMRSRKNASGQNEMRLETNEVSSNSCSVKWSTPMAMKQLKLK